MKRILATTAILALTTVPAVAQTQSDESSATDSGSASVSSGETSMQSGADATLDMNGMQIAASELIGKTVYIRDADAPNEGIVDTIGAPADDWASVGDIKDVVLSADGQIQAVILNVGGFLGIGAKDIQSSMDELKMVAEEGSDGEYFVVFTGNRAALEEREELDRASLQEQGSGLLSRNTQEAPAQNGAAEQDAMSGDQDTASDAATTTADSDQTMTNEQTSTTEDTSSMQNDDGTMSAPSLSDTERAELTAENLEGVAVYDSTDERVGEISDIALTEDGQVEEVIVDVGGFLGLGEKPVAIAFDELELNRDGNDMGGLQARTSISAEEFETMPAWEG